MACVCALGIAAPQPVFGVLCQMTQCVWFMSSGKVAFPARMDVRMVNGEILNLLTYNEWWLMFWYRSCSPFRCLSVGVIDAVIRWYVCTKKHIAAALSKWLLNIFTMDLCNNSIARFHHVVWTPWTFFVHVLSSTQSQELLSKAKAPRIINETMYKLKARTQERKK